jgi:hypothetical protein
MQNRFRGEWAIKNKKRPKAKDGTRRTLPLESQSVVLFYFERAVRKGIRKTRCYLFKSTENQSLYSNNLLLLLLLIVSQA